MTAMGFRKFRIALAIFSPLILLSGLLIALLYQQSIRSERSNLKAETMNSVKRQDERLAASLGVVLKDLLLAAGDAQLGEFLNAPRTNKQDLIEELLLLSRVAKVYDQIRVLDISGMELIRINLTRNAPIVVPDTDLQYKGDRYYFKKILELDRGEIYLSPLDLNIEHGQFETPFKPTIRLGTPIYDRAGNKRGALVFNYLAENILRVVGEYGHSAGYNMLLNKDGYWLVGRTPDEEWGFVIKERRHKRMDSILPLAWQRISAAEKGQFNTEDGLFTFRTVQPGSLMLPPMASPDQKVMKGPVNVEASGDSWKIVSFIPLHELKAKERGIRKSYSLLFLAAVVTVLVMSLFAAEKVLARQQKEEELEHYNEELEYQVRQRTAEVTSAADALRDELAARRQTEDRLRDSEEYNRMLFDQSPIGLAVTRMDGKLVDINHAFAAILGRSVEETLNLSYWDITPQKYQEEEQQQLVSLRSKGCYGPFEKEYMHKDGHLVPVQLQGLLLERHGEKFIWSSVEDISRRKRAEEEKEQAQKQFLHAQKLESLGILAGGIAHDFNNILTAIIGNAELARVKINEESPAVEHLKLIGKAAERAADLAKQMLAYSGKGKFVIKALNLNHLVKDMLHMLDVSISKKAVIKLNLSDGLPSIEADATQIRQIVMNLVINASEAIGDRAGVITITSGYLDCEREYLQTVWLDESLPEGRYVFLEISDNGCGMDQSTISKLFDPFFTTKFSGRGLGMAAVLGIVRGHKGAIKVYSEPDKGSTFKILFRAVAGQAEPQALPDDGDAWKGSGTVLLVDDEEAVRSVGAGMLQELGFDVVTAENGSEAVEAIRGNPSVAFVLLDLTMPEMDGEQCFRELRSIRPDIKVIMSSGFSEQEVALRFAGKGLAGFIPKPYRFSDFKKAIKAIFS